MKKKIIIGVSAAVVVALGVLYFYRAYLFGEDLSKYVPKNAAFVVKIDLISIGKKMEDKKDKKDLTEEPFIKNSLDNLNKEQKEFMTKVIKDPKSSGLNIASSPLIFGFNYSDNEPIVAMILGVSDKGKLKNFIDKIYEIRDEDTKVKDPDDEGFYKAALGDDNSIIYFNGSIAILLSDVSNKKINLRAVRNKIAKMEKSNSILSNEEYVSFNKQPNDLMVYLNKEEIGKIAKKYSNNFGFQESLALSSIPKAVTLNFNEDAISLKTYLSADKSNVFLKDGGLTESELKNIDPNGKPLAYFTINLDTKKQIDYILNQLKSDANASYQINDFNNTIDLMAAELQVSRDEILNTLNGKISFALSDVKMVQKTNPYSLETTNEPNFLLNGWAHLGNKTALLKILELAVTKGTLVNNGGIYSENTVGYDSYNSDQSEGEAVPAPAANSKYFIAIKGNDLFFSTDHDAIASKMQGTDWKSLSTESGKGIVTSKPVTFYADLNYNRYAEILKNSNLINPYILDNLKTVLSEFKEFSVSGDKNESEMLIKFTDEKENSLRRIFDIVKKVFYTNKS